MTTTYSGHVRGGVIVLDGPPPPDGAAVRIEVVANGVAKAPPAPATPVPTTPPADDSDIDPDGVMTPRMIELIRQSQAEEPDAPTGAERWPNFMKHTLDVPDDVLAEAYRALGRGLPQ